MVSKEVFYIRRKGLTFMNRCLAACSTDTTAIGHPRKSQVQDFGAVTMAATMNVRQVGKIWPGRRGMAIFGWDFQIV